MSNTPESLPHLIAVAAMSNNRIIGANGSLPWHFPEDLKFFKNLTSGHSVLMGRKTYESIGRPLPNRQNIILSKTMNQPALGTDLYKSIDDFIADFKGHSDPIFIIGGAQIYSTLMNMTREIFLTHIYEDYDGDAKFPPFEMEFALNKKELVNDQFEICHYIRS
ncbi:dihydrofolate reductase [Verrucomicrobia bacterium]|nr:dihydrofolate reductase [Verrucomicrobiota bacterium]NCG27108.1 dihydrofolate reductase [Verrucomicrobiales bacterium]